VTHAVAFYCVADERYFLGAVAMLNSLRLHGHREPLFVLDCGLTHHQRELLRPHATVVAGPKPDEAQPWLLKTEAPVARPAEVMVLIDADMIVTRPLDPLIEEASRNRIIAFENDRPRFVPEWGEMLKLGATRPGPYVSSGLVLLGGSIGFEVLGLMHDRQREVDMELTLFGRNVADYPFRYPEQDVLNAILRTRVEPDRLHALDNRLAANPPFAGLRLVNRDGVRCAYPDKAEPYVLHHFDRKPWLAPMYHGIYSQLLSRLWLGEDVALRLPETEVPLRMRNGALARAERARVNLVDVFGRYVLKRSVSS
jgi:hypothetical protein